MFGWCMDGHHKDCRRKQRIWHWDAKGKKIVWTDEYSYCTCKAKGCPCKDNDVEANKPRKRKRKQ